MKNIRKILSAFALSSLLITQTMAAPLSVFASEKEETITSEYPHLSYNYTNYVSSVMSVSNGAVYCHSSATGNKKATKISATQYLEKKSGNRWSMYKVWIQTSTGASFSMINGNMGIKDGTYRLRTVFRVYAGSKYETITKCSASRIVKGGYAICDDEPDSDNECLMEITDQWDNKPDILPVIGVSGENVLLANLQTITQQQFKDMSGKSFDLKPGHVIQIMNVDEYGYFPEKYTFKEDSQIVYIGKTDSVYKKLGKKELMIRRKYENYGVAALIDESGYEYTWYIDKNLWKEYSVPFEFDSLKEGDILECAYIEHSYYSFPAGSTPPAKRCVICPMGTAAQENEKKIKVFDDVYSAIDEGQQSINVHIYYKEPDSREIWKNALLLTNEYETSLGLDMYDEQQYYSKLSNYYYDAKKRLNDEAEKNIHAEIKEFLDSIGANTENMDCDTHKRCITVSLTPEQVTKTAESGLITQMAVQPVKLVNLTVDELVAKDKTFANHEVIYSDKYKFAMEGDTLIVYDIPRSDDAHGHVTMNREYSYIVDNMVIDGRDIYSGKRYQYVSSISPNCKVPKMFDIIFFINGLLPQRIGGSYTVEECNKMYGFDVTKYIYGDDSSDRTAEVSTEDRISILANEDPACDGDINGDDSVGIADIIALQKALSERTATLKMDFNGDGKVNVFDLVALKNVLSDNL